MRLRALERRAVSEGVPADAVDDAMDGDDPTASLIASIVEAVSSRGPADQLSAALTVGGDAAAEAVSGVLDHALDLLEQASVSSPRKSRRPIMELLESVEEMLEAVDGAWCDGVSRCGADRLRSLAADLSTVQGLRPADAVPSDAASAVSSLLVSLRECGSVAVQCESVLSPGAESDEGARLCALECVRELSPAALGGVSEPEASLFDVLKAHVCGAESDLSCEERLSCWLSLFVLGCRNGVAVVGRVEVLELAISGSQSSVISLAAAVASGAMDDPLLAAVATHLSTTLVAWEAPCKAPPDLRALLEKCIPTQ